MKGRKGAVYQFEILIQKIRKLKIPLETPRRNRFEGNLRQGFSLFWNITSVSVYWLLTRIDKKILSLNF